MPGAKNQTSKNPKVMEPQSWKPSQSSNRLELQVLDGWMLIEVGCRIDLRIDRLVGVERKNPLGARNSRFLATAFGQLCGTKR